MLGRILRRFSLVRHQARKIRNQRKELRAYQRRMHAMIVENDTWQRTVHALRDGARRVLAVGNQNHNRTTPP